MRGRLWRLTLVAALTSAVLLLGTRSPRNGFFSSACASDSVTFSLEQVDSLTTALDSSETQLRLLRVDLDQCRAEARADSLALTARIADEHQAWWEKMIKHPLVWFALGAYVTAQIGHMQ